MIGVPSLQTLDGAQAMRIWLAVEPTDMRCGFDRLAERVRVVVGQSPLSGQLFVFRSRRGEGLKILMWDRDGFVLWYNLRDMGTQLCALPTGEHCPRGLICLGCTHAHPKKSAIPIFRRMLASHQRGLGAAHEHNEPAGQIASRELEIVRIKGALHRAEN